ncbi:polysaccharide pyruvyl transferase family protein [Halomonas korlensis]|uniref:Polysaccharide pyruvyl transferase n=1 Tax=Halomonas korlensis TaxID=463301 RepID=A0A1I7KDM6_9GAMM|nr:polysaccharide pyruvyl transferase family protein [Halomonas korlensis]SFU95504.1 Polysaccharide pyruvyl transferase [Halomonas korlensis]
MNRLKFGILMKKVGILNFQYSTHNYGAVLQAAALENICRQLGHEAQHLDYMAKPKANLRSFIGKLLRKLGIRKAPQANQVANEEAFERFRQNFIKRTQRIKSAKEFPTAAKGFDSVIVGSDQVWRPAFAKDMLAFFLGYVPKGVDRIAYAASFGTAAWEQADDTVLTEAVRQELQQFRAISCREESGVQICRDVFGVGAEHVLDPLLLVDEPFFEKVVAPSSIQPAAKLVYYKLDSSPEFQEDLKVVGKEIDSDAVNIYLKDSSVREYREVPDWVALIRNSEVVVTDSFHCICLALRFGKEVIFCPNEKRGQTRLDSLFNMLNVSAEPLTVELKTPMFKLVRRGDIAGTLESLRSHSMKFLVDALND